MRISERLYKTKTGGLYCDRGKVTSSMKSSVSAEGTGGAAQLSMVVPEGIEYVPEKDEDAVILCENNERLFIGIRKTSVNRQLNAGELLLYSKGGAEILLTNDGEIKIYGTVYINDEPLEVS